MSGSADIVVTYSVLTCQAEQFVSDSVEIFSFTPSNSLQRIVQLLDTFRQVCSAEQGQIFSLGMIFDLFLPIKGLYLIIYSPCPASLKYNLFLL